MNDAVMPQSSTDEYLAHFRLLMKYCVDGMIIIDGTGLILEFNPAAEEIFARIDGIYSSYGKYPPRSAACFR